MIICLFPGSFTRHAVEETEVEELQSKAGNFHHRGADGIVLALGAIFLAQKATQSGGSHFSHFLDTLEVVSDPGGHHKEGAISLHEELDAFRDVMAAKDTFSSWEKITRCGQKEGQLKEEPVDTPLRDLREDQAKGIFWKHRTSRPEPITKVVILCNQKRED